MLDHDHTTLEVSLKHRFQFGKVHVLTHWRISEQPHIERGTDQRPLPLLTTMGTINELTTGFQSLDVLATRFTNSQGNLLAVEIPIGRVVVRVSQLQSL